MASTYEQMMGRQRDRIDSIDEELIRLLCERMRVALEIGSIKKQTGAPIFCPEREQQVLDSAIRQSEGKIPAEAIDRIFRAIIMETRSVQVTHS